MFGKFIVQSSPFGHLSLHFAAEVAWHLPTYTNAAQVLISRCMADKYVRTAHHLSV